MSQDGLPNLQGKRKPFINWLNIISKLLNYHMLMSKLTCTYIPTVCVMHCPDRLWEVVEFVGTLGLIDEGRQDQKIFLVPLIISPVL